MSIAIIIICILIIGLVFLHINKERNNRINTCVNLFSSYPLYARRRVVLYNEKHVDKVADRVIKQLDMIVDKQTVENEFPHGFIKQISTINQENLKIDDIEKGLKNVIELYQLYPRAITVVFSYSSLSMHRYFINKPYSIEKVLTLSDMDLIHLKLNRQNLQAIEKGIDNINNLNTHLYDIKPIKPDAKSIIELLHTNGQEYLYHFTHKANLKQINELGGLYSWVQLDEMGKPCEHPGGTSLSRNLDVKNGVSDYVHLSFCLEHPMSFYQNNKDIVILLIHPIVCLLPDTLFSNMNATDKEHSIGGGLDDLRKVNFYAVASKYLSSSSKLFKAKQAEVLVKSYIPSKYIVNLEFVD